MHSLHWKVKSLTTGPPGSPYLVLSIQYHVGFSESKQDGAKEWKRRNSQRQVGEMMVSFIEDNGATFVEMWRLWIFKNIHLFNFWLCWVFIAMRAFSLVLASGGYSPVEGKAFSLQGLLLWQRMGSRALGLQ